jgi:hypothetical protein
VAVVDAMVAPATDSRLLLFRGLLVLLLLLGEEAAAAAPLPAGAEGEAEAAADDGVSGERKGVGGTLSSSLACSAARLSMYALLHADCCGFSVNTYTAPDHPTPIPPQRPQLTVNAGANPKDVRTGFGVRRELKPELLVDTFFLDSLLPATHHVKLDPHPADHPPVRHSLPDPQTLPPYHWATAATAVMSTLLI